MTDPAVAAAAPAPVTPPPAAPAASGAPPASPSPGPGPSAPPSPEAQAAAAAWYKDMPEDVRGYVELKGFKDAKSVVESYRNAEKLLSVPQDRILKLPEKMDDASMREIHKRLGMPEKADGYEVKVPAGLNPDFANWAKGLFHEAGLSKAQGDRIAAKWTERVTTLNSDSEKAFADQHVAQIDGLKKEWGAAYDQNNAIAKTMANKLGLTDEVGEKISRAIGVDALNKMLVGITEKFGIKFGEDDFHGAHNAGNDFGALSPGAAKARLAELSADKEWVSRYTNGKPGSAERNEMDRLQRWMLGAQ